MIALTAAERALSGTPVPSQLQPEIYATPNDGLIQTPTRTLNNNDNDLPVFRLAPAPAPPPVKKSHI